MNTADIPSRKTWKRDLASYLEIDRARSLGQIASVVVPYLGVWVVAALLSPSAWLAIGLGLVATVFLMRMYSLFHDLTHNSLFESRGANTSGAISSASCSSRPTAGGSASTACTTRTRATSTSGAPARSTR